LEASIDVAERRQKEIQAAYASPGFYETKTPAELELFRKEERALAEQVEALMAQWEAIEGESIELEAL
jgi:hypothetical protein